MLTTCPVLLIDPFTYLEADSTDRRNDVAEAAMNDATTRGRCRDVEHLLDAHV
jgi:hypothetical protein